jgi:hypothetical protein
MYTYILDNGRKEGRKALLTKIMPKTNVLENKNHEGK